MKRLLVIFGTLLALLIPVSASALNPFDVACHGSAASQSAACAANGSSDPISGPHGVLKKVSLLLATIASIAAVIIIIVGGMQLVISNGDPSKVSGARSAITGALIGLVIIVAAETIVLFVVSKV